MEKKHRLPLACYIGPIRASFTLCIQNRHPIFVNAEIVNLFVNTLNDAKRQQRCENWAYIFMPDHAHIVFEGTSTCQNLWKAMVLFKQNTGYWLSKNMPEIKWQKNFYDRIHRTEDELLNHILYIVNNPVRKGLVTHWQEYPFTGSLDNDLSAIVWD